MPSGKLAKRSLLVGKSRPLKISWVIAAGVGAVCYLLFVHPDVMETANHAYLMLESLFSGRIAHFYEDVMLHQNTLYYINNAHYNIVVYVIFAVFELPVFIFNAIFKTAVNEVLLYYIGKLVGMAFWAGSIFVFKKVAIEYGISEKDSEYATLFFALCTPAVFSVAIMGQYDSICLFFTLMAILQWLRGDYLKFALWVGVGAACKFFPLFIFLPLVLLREKRVIHIIKYGVLSLWVILPTALLYMGRTGDMSIFTEQMISRLFSAKIPAAMDMPILPAIYAVICVAAWLWKPKDEQLKKAGIWLCLAAYAVIFVFSFWHPQWIILLAPFLILTTFAEKNRERWFFVDIVLAIGFFIYCMMGFGGQLEAGLLDFGLVGIVSGLQMARLGGAFNSVLFYYMLVPVLSGLPMVLFAGALISHVVFKIPLEKGTPAYRLCGGQADGLSENKMIAYAWVVFAVPFFFWLVPVLFTWLKALKFI